MKSVALLLFCSMAWSCAAAPAAPVPPASPPVEPATRRWGDVQIVRPDPLLGEAPIPYGSTLHTGDALAIRVELHRPGFARIVNIGPSGETAFERDLGMVVPVGEKIRIPAGASDYLHLDPVRGTEYVVLMISEARLDSAAVESLRRSVLEAEVSPSGNGKRRKARKAKPEPDQPPPEAAGGDASPNRELDLRDRGLDEGFGRYLETEPGERAVTWIRFEHRGEARP